MLDILIRFSEQNLSQKTEIQATQALEFFEFVYITFETGPGPGVPHV
jgi:hypothetical protein